MKIAISVIFLTLSWSFFSCVTGDSSSSSDAKIADKESVMGMLDDNNKLVIPVPDGLPLVPAHSSKKGSISRKTTQVNGLGSTLEGDVETFSISSPVGGVGEGLSSACYSIDTHLPNPNWHFYAEAWLGPTFIQAADTSIENCGDVELTLSNLRENETYKIRASIYYHDEHSKRDQVLYEGSTVLFQSGDTNVSLRLKKL